MAVSEEVRIVDVGTSKVLHQWEEEGLLDKLETFGGGETGLWAWSPDGDHLAVAHRGGHQDGPLMPHGNYFGDLRIMEITAERRGSIFETKIGRPNLLAFRAEDNSVLVSGGGRAEAWSLESGERLWLGRIKAGDHPLLSPGLTGSISSTSLFRLRVLDLATGESGPPLEITNGRDITAQKMGLSADLERLAIVHTPERGGKARLSVFRTDDWKVEWVMPWFTWGDLSLEFSPLGDRLAIATESKVRIIDAATGERVGKPISGCVARFSPDGRYCLLLGEDVLLVDSSSGKVLYEYEGLPGMMAAIKGPNKSRQYMEEGTLVQFSPNQSRVGLRLKDGKAMVLDCESGEVLLSLQASSREILWGRGSGGGGG
ncbi:MAG: WD40 repeat domain-containing protein, partial [Planctomycetota bacterium]|nr:WD40 repeat domain-containing protein [Planctomycetota bacterium]